jgi:hypothetical protein
MRGLLIALISLTFNNAMADSLMGLKEKYQPLSPLQQPRISSEQVLETDATILSPLEEQVAEIRSQEEEGKNAETEKVYLDTDYQFFQTLAVPNEDDELDLATKKDEVAVIIEKNAIVNKTVAGEIKTSAPKPLTVKQGLAFDKRRTLILKKIAKNGQHVRACIIQHQKPGIAFKGTAMTLAWELEPSGKVENPQVKATDVEHQAIKDCVLKSLAEWNFSDILKNKTKRSHIEYTYRFVNAGPPAQAKN